MKIVRREMARLILDAKISTKSSMKDLIPLFSEEISVDSWLVVKYQPEPHANYYQIIIHKVFWNNLMTILLLPLQ